MIERYLEQQAAVTSAMADEALEKNVKDIVKMSSCLKMT